LAIREGQSPLKRCSGPHRARAGKADEKAHWTAAATDDDRAFHPIRCGKKPWCRRRCESRAQSGSRRSQTAVMVEGSEGSQKTHAHRRQANSECKIWSGIHVYTMRRDATIAEAAASNSHFVRCGAGLLTCRCVEFPTPLRARGPGTGRPEVRPSIRWKMRIAQPQRAHLDPALEDI
jgi:hypothetical protein